MDPVLALTLQGLQLDRARLDRLAANLANAQTLGFKRELEAARLDVQPGTLRTTHRSLDLAIAGSGWFEVATPQGTAYTRQGDFRLDARGRLVTVQGHAVMGVSGEILLAQPHPVIDAEGRVYESSAAHGEPMGQLKLVHFDRLAPVERLGSGLVRIAGTPEPAPAGASMVRQGALENSNVDPAREMVQLLRTLRHAESLQKAASAYDDLLGTAIRRLGETN
jgi:flagellar basal-body rod protein FlgF